jgi:type I restriction-modification system DNA methylase subunit
MKKSKLAKSSQRIPSPIEGFVQKTEWTATAKIMEWINSIIKDKNLPIGISEVETKLKGEGKRPDIVIYRGRLDEEIICLLEFKSPFYESDDEENLKEPARKKATNRKSRYFATSNFQSLILFNTAKVNAMRPIEEQVVEKYPLSTLEDLNEIETPKFRNSIHLGLEKFLLDLTEFVTGKKAEPLIEINLLLVWRLQEKINRLARYYKRIIEDECHKNKEFRRQLKKWFADQMWEFNAQEADFDKAARQTAYLLINKIIFYNALQSKRQSQLDPLNIPDDLTKGGLLQKHLQNYFDYVLKNIDYETIYSADFIDSLAFPENEAVVTEIKNLVKILKRYNFSKLGFDIIGHIFERLIPQEERHNLGQYFTNSNIVDVILRFCLQHEKDKVLDPACGAGTFLVRAYQHKKLMNSTLTHEEILDSLWGVDVAKFPAHLSTINLAINDLSVDKNYPNIVHEDFFNLHSSLEGLELPEQWRKVRAVSLGKTPKEITYPRWFDCIVGNPPYTRQEEISEIAPEDKKYKIGLIQKALLDMKGRKIAEISKRAGIHAYFFIHGIKFLKNGGRFGFIVSNSWLDVDYGKGLQEFFLKNYKILSIIESKVERWFEDADINTCIVILEKCADGSLRNENLVRFVYLKKRLSDFIPAVSDMWMKSKERIERIDDLRKTVLFHDEVYENEDLRIFPKRQKELWEEGFDPEEQKYVGAKWGKYLRAPDIFFKILKKGKDKFVPLKGIADVRFGIKTGANEFFYLTKEEIEKWEIEKEFWMHKDEKGNWVPNYVIKSPRECKSIIVKPEDLKYRVLMIHKDKKDLKGKRVLDYIHWGERKGFHKRPTCESRRRWYELQETKAHILSKRFVDVAFGYFLNPYELFVGDTFFSISFKNIQNVDLLGAILNSTVWVFLTEIYGRTGMGEGVLLIYGPEIAPMPVLNLDHISESKKTEIAKKFGVLKERTIDSIFDEFGASYPEEVSLDKVKPDRRELDKIIMGDILGLTDEEQLEVYRAVVDLVKSRIGKAKSMGKKKKTKEGIDIELLVKSVLSRIGEETLGKFYREMILSKPCYEKNLLEIKGKITVEKDLFKWRLSGDNMHIECESEIEANYLKNFVGTGVTAVKIPKDNKYLKHILPELERIRQNIDTIIEEDVLSIISPKTQNQILHILWQEIMKIGG